MSSRRIMGQDSLRPRVVSIDGFGTVFSPKKPIAVLYAQLAKEHAHLSVPVDTVSTAFKKAFKEQKTQFPYYGKHANMQPSQWWAGVIRGTFHPATIDDDTVKSFLDYFASKAAYTLHPDAIPLFEYMQAHHPEIKMCIASNWDKRIGKIFDSFGISRYFAKIITSYECCFEKPERRFFEFIARTFQVPASHIWHVGDNWQEDVQGAKDGGCKAIYLDRDDLDPCSDIIKINRLTDLIPLIEQSQTSD